MAKQTPKAAPKKPENKPKFNFYWIYIIIAVLFIGLQFANSGNSAKKIGWQEFKTQLLESGDVEKLVGFKQDDIYVIEVYIQKEKLRKEKYKEFQDRSFGASGAQYYFTESSPEVLQTKLDAAQE